MNWTYKVNDFFICNARGYLGDKDIETDLAIASIEDPGNIALDLNLVYRDKENPCRLFLCRWNRENEEWEDLGYVEDITYLRYHISFGDLGNEQLIKKQMLDIFEIICATMDSESDMVEKTLREKKGNDMIDILKLNAEIDKMIQTQDAEVKDLKKATYNNQKEIVREFADFIYPYMDTMKKIVPYSDTARLVIKEKYLDGVEFHRGSGFSSSASVVIRPSNTGLYFTAVKDYGDRNNEYWFSLDESFEKCSLRRNGNIAKTWFDGSVTDNYNVYNVIVPFCKVVLKNRNEIENDLREQLLKKIKEKAEMANRRYEEAQKQMRESNAMYELN